MTQELQYTSAVRGLQTGVKGFGPVVATRDLSPALSERLVALSGYRHLYAAHERNAKLNPVNYAHLLVTLGGKPHHVLSRIADAGLDYSQRSNKFAHHLVLDESELVAGGPAWLLAQPGFTEQGYHGEPRWLESGRKVPQGNSAPSVCRAWQKLTGDAGWGGVLAETALASTRVPTVIVFQPGTDTLALIVESLNLLPAARRWQVTFSTFFTSFPPGTDCLWRCMVAGDQETLAACRSSKVRVIDLTQPLGQATGGVLVEAARTGKLPASATAQSSNSTAAKRNGTATKSGQAQASPVLGLGPLESLELVDFFGQEFATPSAAVHEPTTATPNLFVKRLIAASVIVVVALIAAIALRSLFTTTASIVSPQPTPAVAVVAPVPVDKPSLPVAEVEVKPSKTLDKLVVETEPKSVVGKADIISPLEAPPIKVASLPSPKIHDPVAAPRVDRFEQLIQQMKHEYGVDLPALPYKGSPLARSTSSDLPVLVVEAAEIDPKRVMLNLQSPTEVKARFELTPPVSEGGTQRWTIVRKTGSPAGDDRMATLSWNDRGLSFAWLTVLPAMQPELLSRCRLLIGVNGRSVSMLLHRPVPLALGELSIAMPSNSLSLPAGTSSSLVAEIQTSDTEDAISSTTPHLLTEEGKLSVLVLGGALEWEVAFVSRGAKGLEARPWWKRTEQDATGKRVERRVLLDAAVIQSWSDEDKQQFEAVSRVRLRYRIFAANDVLVERQRSESP